MLSLGNLSNRPVPLGLGPMETFPLITITWGMVCPNLSGLGFKMLVSPQATTRIHLYVTRNLLPATILSRPWNRAYRMWQKSTLLSSWSSFSVFPNLVDSSSPHNVVSVMHMRPLRNVSSLRPYLYLVKTHTPAPCQMGRYSCEEQWRWRVEASADFMETMAGNHS